MQGRTCRQAGYLLLFGSLLLAASCSESIAPVPSDESPGHSEMLDVSSEFDASRTGSIEGRVVWQDEIPSVEPIGVQRSLTFVPAWADTEVEKEFPNPNAPVINTENRGVGNAVVFLRNVDVKTARPWDHEPVDVSIRDYEIHVHQGTTVAQTGFVRSGDKVNFVCKEDRFHIIRGRWADNFSLTLPLPNKSRSRELNTNGLIELSNAAEYYWLRGYLFVDDHPYYARTDANGKFTLKQVPEGTHELVAWMANWQRKEHHRNPETREISRLYFHAPAEYAKSITIKPGHKTNEEIRFDLSAFAK